MLKIFWLVYGVIFALLALYSIHRLVILYWYFKYYAWQAKPESPPIPRDWPSVTVQLPLYNERYVVERLLDTVCALDYPRDRLHIQVLDDSTDETQSLAHRVVRKQHDEGLNIEYLHRPNRDGFKGGALAEGLKTARGEFIAIFDADFLPSPDFLRLTVPWFVDSNVGMVQTRWGHANADHSLLTSLQAMFLDGHFMLEHTARNFSGRFMNFNGTAGVWRTAAINTSGGWQHDTLTEDLDLSYRAQLAGWRFVFLPEVECRAELPEDMNAFKSQQHRWTKGSVQVAKKLLPDIWRARLPLAIKVEATAHLLSNVGYVLVGVLSCLVVPSLWLRMAGEGFSMIRWWELIVIGLTICSMAMFFGVSQAALYENWTRRIRLIPALLALGFGMCLNNGKAVLEGVWGTPSPFHRTPKGKGYRGLRSPLGWVELSFALIIGVGLGYSVMATPRWIVVPFAFLFMLGYVYVGVLTFWHARPIKGL